MLDVRIVYMLISYNLAEELKIATKQIEWKLKA